MTSRNFMLYFALFIWSAMVIELSCSDVEDIQKNNSNCLAPIEARNIEGHPIVQPLNYPMFNNTVIASNKTLNFSVCYFGEGFVLSNF